jgi:cysteine desulfurase
LRAIGVEEDLAHTSIRFGLGRFNNEEEVDYVVRRVVEEVRRLRELSPLYKARKVQQERREPGENKLQERVS